MSETDSAVLSTAKFWCTTCFLYVDLGCVHTAGLQASMHTHTGWDVLLGTTSHIIRKPEDTRHSTCLTPCHTEIDSVVTSTAPQLAFPTSLSLSQLLTTYEYVTEYVPDQLRNSVNSSSLPQISWKTTHNFWSYSANKQTDKETNTSQQR